MISASLREKVDFPEQEQPMTINRVSIKSPFICAERVRSAKVCNANYQCII